MTERVSFRDRSLPRAGRLTGYAFLIDALALDLPLPHELTATARIGGCEKADGWIILPNARWPGPELTDHLLFAIRYEPVDLRVLSAVFNALGPELPTAALRRRPGSRFARRLCFLYEWLTREPIKGVPAVTGTVVGALDDAFQYDAPNDTAVSRKYRVADNLPGTRDFCPLVSRTRRLDALVRRDVRAEAEAVMDDAPDDVVGRAAAYLLLKDSQASFEIEGERPSRDREQRWAQTLGDAGRTALTTDRLLDLQRQVIGDSRMIALGLRQEGGFVGEHDALGLPRPDHVSARADDLPSLIGGLIDYAEKSARQGYPPVLAAAAVAFGFVYVHPFEDGNGRVHRYLIHHVLAERGVSPPGVIFPVSSAMADDILAYRQTLEAVTRPMQPHIAWLTTPGGNVEVTNETAPLYRYFDATRNAEFLYGSVLRTIERDLPDELRFLAFRDRFHREGTRIIDMPERTLDALLHALRGNGGQLSKRKRTGAFERLTDGEVSAFETLYATLDAAWRTEDEANDDD